MVAAALLVIAATAAGMVAAGQRQQRVKAGPDETVSQTNPVRCEPLPGGYNPAGGVTLRVHATALPEGWEVLPPQRSVSGYTVGQIGAASPVASAPTLLPLIGLIAVLREEDFINDYRRGEILKPTRMVSPAGTFVTLWTDDGAPMPLPSAAARWQLANGTWAEASTGYGVTLDQLMTVVDSTVGPDYCGVTPVPVPVTGSGSTDPGTGGAANPQPPVMTISELGSVKGTPLGSQLIAVAGGVADTVDVAVSEATLPGWWQPSNTTPPFDFAKQVLFFVSLRRCAAAGIDFVDIVTASTFGAEAVIYQPLFYQRPVTVDPCPQSTGQQRTDVRSYVIAVDRARLSERFDFVLNSADPAFVPPSHISIDLSGADLETSIVDRRATLS
ncbi:MAG: hypothetical protein ACKV2O_15200 [Acidimicrobiales bacterium]